MQDVSEGRNAQRARRASSDSGPLLSAHPTPSRPAPATPILSPEVTQISCRLTQSHAGSDGERFGPSMNCCVGLTL